MAYWAKVSTDVLSDPKLMKAARSGAKNLEFLLWILVFAKKSDDNGRLSVGGKKAEVEDIADTIPTSKALARRGVKRCLEALLYIGILAEEPDGVLRFTRWDRRQYGKPSDTPERVTARVKAHRERTKSGPPSNAPSNASGNTPRNTPDVDVEREKERDVDVDVERNAPTPPDAGAARAASNLPISPPAEADTRPLPGASVVIDLLKTQAGEHWTEIDRFLRSRSHNSQDAWVREFAKIVGPGSQFQPIDLARACADALALDQPLSGPHGLRAFVSKSWLERTSKGVNEKPGANRTRGAATPGAAPLAAIIATVVDPKAEARRQQRQVEFSNASGDAGIAWGNDAANAAGYHSIVAKANAMYREKLGTPLGDKMRAEYIVAECARASGFPRSFEDWEAGPVGQKPTFVGREPEARP